MRPRWARTLALVVLAAGAGANFVIKGPAQSANHVETPLEYDAPSDTWRFYMSCPVSGDVNLIIPQLCPPDRIDECRLESIDDAGTCASTNSLMRAHNGVNSSWVNTNLLQHNDNECFFGDSEFTQTQRTYGSATADEFVRAHQPGLITLSRNPAQLLLYGAPDAGGYRVFVRFLCVSDFEDILQTVKSHSIFLVLGEFDRPFDDVFMRNECQLRGLTSPRVGQSLLEGGSFLQVVPDVFGNRACHWGCGATYLKFPWNSAPQWAANATTTRSTRECIALPPRFMAVEFRFSLFSHQRLDPRALDQHFLDELDALALLMQSVFAASVARPVVLLDVSGTDVFATLIRRVPAGRRETVTNTAPLLSHTLTDIIVRAVVLHESMRTSVTAADQTLAAAFAQTQAFAFADTVVISHITSLELLAVHRVIGPPLPPPREQALVRTLITTIQITCAAVAAVCIISYVVRNGAPP